MKRVAVTDGNSPILKNSTLRCALKSNKRTWLEGTGTSRLRIQVPVELTNCPGTLVRTSWIELPDVGPLTLPVKFPLIPSMASRTPNVITGAIRSNRLRNLELIALLFLMPSPIAISRPGYQATRLTAVTRSRERSRAGA